MADLGGSATALKEGRIAPEDLFPELESEPKPEPQSQPETTSTTTPGKATKSGYTDRDWRAGSNGCIVDSEAPKVTAYTIPATSSSRTVAISTFSASDNIGISAYLITESAIAPLPTATGWTAIAPTSHTLYGCGRRTLYAWVKDVAGNVSQAASATTLLDNALCAGNPTLLLLLFDD